MIIEECGASHVAAFRVIVLALLPELDDGGLDVELLEPLLELALVPEKSEPVHHLVVAVDVGHVVRGVDHGRDGLEGTFGDATRLREDLVKDAVELRDHFLPRADHELDESLDWIFSRGRGGCTLIAGRGCGALGGRTIL